MSTDELSLPEITRSLARVEKQIETLAKDTKDRHHELANSVHVALGPISMTVAKVEVNSRDLDKVATLLDKLAERTRNIELRAASVAGVITGTGFLEKYLLMGNRRLK